MAVSKIIGNAVKYTDVTVVFHDLTWGQSATGLRYASAGNVVPSGSTIIGVMPYRLAQCPSNFVLHTNLAASDPTILVVNSDKDWSQVAVESAPTVIFRIIYI